MSNINQHFRKRKMCRNVPEKQFYISHEDLPSLSSLSVQKGLTSNENGHGISRSFIPPTPVVSPLPDRIDIKRCRRTSDLTEEADDKIISTDSTNTCSNSLLSLNRQLQDELDKSKLMKKKLKLKRTKRTTSTTLGYMAITSAFYRAQIERFQQEDETVSASTSSKNSTQEEKDATSVFVAVR